MLGGLGSHSLLLASASHLATDLPSLLQTGDLQGTQGPPRDDMGKALMVLGYRDSGHHCVSKKVIGEHRISKAGKTLLSPTITASHHAH